MRATASNDEKCIIQMSKLECKVSARSALELFGLWSDDYLVIKFNYEEVNQEIDFICMKI